MAQDLLQDLRLPLEQAHRRHRRRFAAEVTELTRRLSREHQFQLDLILSSPALARSFAPPAAGLREALRDYLLSMQWVIWGDCELGPPLALPCNASETALGVLAYLGARLLDDAIDGHLDYKGRARTFYGVVQARAGTAAAGAASAAAGAYLVTEALRRLERHGFGATAAALRSLYGEVFAGALAEALAEPSRHTLSFYHAVVQHKAVAYDRLLHLAFLSRCPQPPRDAVLTWLAQHSEISQWLNDYCDQGDDRRRGQLNLVAIQGSDRARVARWIRFGLTRLFVSSRRLPPALSDALALRLLDSVQQFAAERPDAE